MISFNLRKHCKHVIHIKNIFSVFPLILLIIKTIVLFFSWQIIFKHIAFIETATRSLRTAPWVAILYCTIIITNYLNLTRMVLPFLIEKKARSFIVLSKTWVAPFICSSTRCKVGWPMWPGFENSFCASMTSFWTAMLFGNFFFTDLPFSSYSFTSISCDVNVVLFGCFTRRLSSGMPYSV